MRLLPALALACLALTAPAAAQTALPASRAEIQLSFAPVVKATTPAVVNVYARTRTKVATSPLFDDPLFRQFFGNIPGGTQERVQSSLGSGVIVDPAGLIVTNNHVVQDATDVRVALNDKREFDAKVLIADERTDLAVLRIDTGGAPLPALAFADSDAVQIGDLVLAIGNPFGVGQTVTSGIVSALARTEIGVSDYQFFIQTDAAINPGNSGGALVDMQGRLLGINSAIYSRSGGSVGIGFAIPANMVKVILAAARNGGKIVRPWMGVAMQDVTNDMAPALGLPRPEGALIADLDPASPIRAAGLKAGDVVIAVNGTPIDAAKEIVYRIMTQPVGSSVELRYVRSGKEATASVKLMAAPETVPRDEMALSGNTPFAGLKVANLSPAVADELDMPLPGSGVVVMDVTGGPAARIGFKKGDVIVSLNGAKIDSVASLRKVLAAGQSGWDFSVRRGSDTLRMRIGG